MPGEMLRGWEGKSILPSVAEASVDSKSWEQMTSSHTKDLRRCHNRKDYQKMDALSITGGVLRLQRWKGKPAPTGPGGGGTQGHLHEVLADLRPLHAGFLHESSLIPKRERGQFACTVRKDEGNLHPRTGHPLCFRSQTRRFIDMTKLDITLSYTFAHTFPWKRDQILRKVSNCIYRERWNWDWNPDPPSSKAHTFRRVARTQGRLLVLVTEP